MSRIGSKSFRAGLLGLALSASLGASAQTATPAAARTTGVPSEQQIRSALQAAQSKYQNLKEGKNADYIPALAKVDPKIFGIAVVTPDGKVYTSGDIKSEVSIQSISKVFTMALVMEEQGPEALANNMGVDATGQVFNSIVAVEQYKGKEMNPMVNPGAITATSMVSGASRDAKWQKILNYYSAAAGRPLSVNQEVFKSEADTNQRNRAIAMLMLAYEHIKGDPLEATDVYTEQCSVSVNAKDLATMAATLANGGRNPVTGKQVIKAENVPEILAVMATAGLYDDSGKWLFRTGLPAKSGVGGGIVAVQPEQFGIGTFSPRLDDRGNSVRGVAMLQALSQRFGLHMLASRGLPLSSIAELDRDVGGDTVAVLRGEIFFAGAEEVLTRLAPLVGDDGCLVLDFTNVTRVGGAARAVFLGVPEIAGVSAGGRPRVAIRDPDGVLRSGD
jgi:glutaminase